jgi:hypothetical protein
MRARTEPSATREMRKIRLSILPPVQTITGQPPEVKGLSLSTNKTVPLITGIRGIQNAALLRE